MGINVTKARLPVEFELNDDTDSRFKKVKVWIAHTGENLNNSYFTKEVLQEMSETLPRIPIVGYIEVNGDNEEDFSDHRQEIVIKSGEGADIRYAGHAYGFMPEDCNPQFELRDGKEWLTAEGYVWTKFKDAFNIFNEANGTKSHSMEIEQAEGEVDDIGRMVITSAVFSALCILGEDVSPAMKGSTIEFFSDKKHQYQFELDEMIQEFEREKGELDLTQNEQENAQEPIVEPELQPDIEPESIQEPEVQVEPEPAITDEGSQEPEPQPEGEPDVAPEPEDNEQSMFSIEGNTVKINFQLSHEDQRSGLYKALNGMIERGYNYIYSVFNDRVIVEQVTYDEDYDNRQEKLLSVKFTVENDEIVIGESEEVFPMYLNAQEKVTIENQREEIATLNARLEELSEFKQESETKEKEGLVDKYAKELEEEVVKDIKANFSKMSVEDVEKEVALQYFKKVQAEKEETEVSVGVSNFNQKETKTQKYGDLDRFFKQ